MTNLEKAANTILNECFAVKKTEKVLIITDKNLIDIAQVIYKASLNLAETKLIEIPVGKQHGEEPPKEIADEMKKYDVIIAPTSKSLSHTKARVEANKNARIATMPTITKDMMERLIDLDYNEMAKITNKLKDILDKGKDVHVTTKAGTDIKFSIDKRKAIASTGLTRVKGNFGNLPGGETFIAPLEKTADGIIIIDGSILNKKTKIRVVVENGYAVEIDDDELRSYLDDINNKDAFNIAEFGIGTNKKAEITGKTLENEKAIKTCHFGFGNNFGFGGKVNVPSHIDGVLRNPTIYIDKKMIIEEGKILV